MYRNISVKVGLVMLVAALGPLLALLLTSYYELRNGLAAHVMNSLENNAGILAANIGNHIVSANSALTVVAKSRFVTRFDQYPLNDVETELARMQRYTRIFDDLTLVDDHGIVRASSTYTYQGEWPGKTWYLRAKSGRDTLGRAHLMIQPERTVAIMCVPVERGQYNPLLVLCGRIPLQYTDPPKRYEDYSLSDIILRTSLGETGRNMLVSDRGRVLVIGENSRLFELWREPNPLLQLLYSGGGSTWIKRDDGLFAAAVFVDDSMQVMRERWAIVTTIDQDEALAPMAGLLRGLALSVLLAVALALLLALVFSRRMTARIHSLASATDRLALGDLSARVKVSGEDEIGHLAKHFNEMADDLAGAMSRIRESEERYRTLVETAGEGILALNHDGVILHANPALERMLGVTGMMGQVFGEFIKVMEPEDIGSRELLVPPQPTQEMLWRTSSGKNVWVIYAARRMERVGFYETTTFAVITDITERKNMERQLASYSMDLERMVEERTIQLADQSSRLAAALSRVEKTDKSKGEFISRMSHELRTPLNSIIGFAKMIQKDGGKTLPSQVLDDVRIIEENGEYLLMLLNNVLDVSKIQAGMMDLEIDQVDAGDVAQNACETVKGIMLKKQNVKLVNDLIDRDIWVRADYLRLQQVFANLLSNAIKFTEEGEIRLSAKLEEGQWHFIVSDTGVGIAETDLDRIFEEFQQTKSGRHQGSGLGLALVRLLVNKMGGRVWAESEQGVGSKFHFTLHGALPEDLQTLLNEDHTDQSEPPQVLVINDNIQVSDFLVEMLHAEGIGKVDVAGVDQALAALRLSKPDFVLVSLDDAETDIFLLLRQMQNDSDGMNTGIVLTSVDPIERNGYAMAIDTLFDQNIGRKCLQRANQILGKPLERVLLIVDRVDPAIRVSEQLNLEGVEVIKAFTVPDALELIDNVRFDCCLVDITIAGGQGLHLLFSLYESGKLTSVGLLIPDEVTVDQREAMREKSNILRQKRTFTGEMLRRALGLKQD